MGHLTYFRDVSEFRFKQFKIRQENAAMKVGTDGVLLGAWVDVMGRQKILDVGTGTGLLAMMIAQRNNNAEIDAIDINPEAIKDASYNINASPFHTQIHVSNVSLHDWNEGLYDLVVSNPPYFENALKAATENRSQARHVETDGLSNWLIKCIQTSKETGLVALVIPVHALDELVLTAEDYNWYPYRICRVRGHAQKPVKRVLLELKYEQQDCLESELVIEVERHQYTDEYINLTKPFYLNM